MGWYLSTGPISSPEDSFWPLLENFFLYYIPEDWKFCPGVYETNRTIQIRLINNLMLTNIQGENGLKDMALRKSFIVQVQIGDLPLKFGFFGGEA